ncbi:MAG TPA: PilT/PilU family type 4a pilus ATPase [Kofleriaceae bacterium]|nr:PilT/PilU family type 4a pilus ATPase [Kofleriaceae bacterium]
MAAVDSLIRLITAQNADSLVLATDQVPRLTRAGATQPLSMPPVGAAMMDTFVAEVLTPEQIAESQSAGAVTVDRGEFTATVKRQSTGWAMTFFRRAPGRAAATTAAPPPAAPSPTRLPARPATPPAPPRDRPRDVERGAAAREGDLEPGREREARRGPGREGERMREATLPAAPPAAARLADAVAELPHATSDLVDRWLRRAIAEQATDVIVSAGLGARLRVPGGLVDLPGGALDDEQIAALAEPWLGQAQRAALAAHGSTDFALVWRDPAGGGAAHETHRFRVNLFRQGGGMAAVLRPVRRHPPALADLGLPEHLARLARYPNGLVLVTGPSGAGKSTTLVALVEQLNRELPRHVLTIEDPIEYEYRSQLAIVHQRELGAHVDSFEAGLRAALRESPDVILLGEMRDRVTIAAAITAAETGHLVLSSLHAGSAAMAVERVIDVFPEHQQRQVRSQLAGTLRAVLTQHLLPSTSPGMRVPAVEVMIVTAAVGSLIRDGKTHQLASAIQTGRDDGMIPLDRSLADLVEAGMVAYETAAAATLDDGQQLRELLGRAGAGGGGRGRGRAPR